MKKILIVFGVLASLVLITVLVIAGCGANAGTGSSTASAAAQANTKRLLSTNIIASGTNTGSISGTITNILTGDTIYMVSVEAEGIATITDTNGNYTLSGIPAGTVSLIVSHADYDKITFVSSASSVSIALLPINRSPKGSLTGIVTDRNGNPVEGATVNATSSTYFQKISSYTQTS